MRFPIERLPLAVPVGVQTESGVEEIGFDVAEWLREWPEIELSNFLQPLKDRAACDTT